MLSGQEDIESVEQAMKGDNLIGFVLMKNEDVENPSAKDLHSVGTVAKIVKKINLPGRRTQYFHLHAETVSGSRKY